MADTYKITAVHGSKEWNPSQGGTNVDFRIEIDGLEGEHTLTQKKDGPHSPPQPGDEIFGHVEDGGKWPSGDPKPPKLKRDMQGSGFRANGGGQAPKDWEASGRAQGRAHAQEMALRLAGLQLQAGQRNEIDGKSLVPLIDWFYDDAQAAKAEGYRQ